MYLYLYCFVIVLFCIVLFCIVWKTKGSASFCEISCRRIFFWTKFLTAKTSDFLYLICQNLNKKYIIVFLQQNFGNISETKMIFSFDSLNHNNGLNASGQHFDKIIKTSKFYISKFKHYAADPMRQMYNRALQVLISQYKCVVCDCESVSA